MLRLAEYAKTPAHSRALESDTDCDKKAVIYCGDLQTQDPCRKPRQNRKQAKKKLPPSTRARWQWKLRLARWLCCLFPVSLFVVEDIKATTKPTKGCWNRSFSPLEVGKRWFYAELAKLAPVHTRQGYETKGLREQVGLKKTGKKLAEVWEAHCVDAWVLAYSAVGGKTHPDTIRLVSLSPLSWHHRITITEKDEAKRLMMAQATYVNQDNAEVLRARFKGFPAQVRLAR